MYVKKQGESKSKGSTETNEGGVVDIKRSDGCEGENEVGKQVMRVDRSDGKQSKGRDKGEEGR